MVVNDRWSLMQVVASAGLIVYVHCSRFYLTWFDLNMPCETFHTHLLNHVYRRDAKLVDVFGYMLSDAASMLVLYEKVLF